MLLGEGWDSAKRSRTSMMGRFTTLAAGLFATAYLSGIHAGDPGDTTGAWEGIEDSRRELLRTLEPNRDPARIFLGFSLSQRTTYDAISHALSRTLLTHDSGTPMGSLMDLVERVDRVAGERKGAGRDEQFRIYCRMKPEARQVLSQSREFYRGFNNCIFHRGYPISYRQGGGSPKIQVSLSRDGRQADIDIDYLMPLPLIEWFNGHLGTSNSDVRAGNNYRRHNRRWRGLVAWWRNLFRLPEDSAATAAEVLPPNRPKDFQPADLADAAQEFLTDWLVRGRHDEARALLAGSARGCAHGVDRALPSLERLMPRIRRSAALADAIASVDPWDPDLQAMPHAFSKQFSVVAIPADRAGVLTCEGRGQEQAVYQTMFRFLVHGDDAGALALTWQRDARGWRIVSYRLIEG
jgi:hypothetical protein